MHAFVSKFSKFASAVETQRNFSKTPEHCAIKQMLNATPYTIDRVMHALKRSLSTKEARVTLKLLSCSRVDP